MTKRALVKICGVTHSEDAALAAQDGADFIGVIFAAQATRRVSTQAARTIADTAAKYGAQTVGVFVEQNAGDILRLCRETGIQHAQLHGTPARAAYGELHEKLRILFVQSPRQEAPALTPSLHPENFIVMDAGGGTGTPFEYAAFQPPIGARWLLAGGLTPDNVAAAILTLRPHGVDVSSGVCGADPRRKDPAKVRRFLEQVRSTDHAIRRNVSCS